MQRQGDASAPRPRRSSAPSSASLRQLMALARRMIEAGLPLSEPEVLQLCNRILACLEAKRAAGTVTEDLLAVPDTLLQLHAVAVGAGREVRYH